MRKIIVILGPTASGKTGMALDLANKFNGFIISADSRLIYQGMDIGTAKPSLEERKRVPHHLIDILNPDEGFSLAQYQKAVYAIIKESANSSPKANSPYLKINNKVADNSCHLPFLVGGTGLYIQSIVDNLDIPKGEPDKLLRGQLENKSNEELCHELLKLDPDAAHVIDKNNKRRLIRALEVCLKTGDKFSSQQKKNNPVVEALQIGIDVPRETLYQRINDRVDMMIKQGFIEETKALGLKYGYEIPSMSAIGYKQIGEYLKGNKTLPEAIEEIKKETRHYAKRQITWFKRDKRIHWVKNKEEAEKLIKAFIEQ